MTPLSPSPASRACDHPKGRRRAQPCEHPSPPRAVEGACFRPPGCNLESRSNFNGSPHTRLRDFFRIFPGQNRWASNHVSQSGTVGNAAASDTNAACAFEPGRLSPRLPTRSADQGRSGLILSAVFWISLASRPPRSSSRVVKRFLPSTKPSRDNPCSCVSSHRCTSAHATGPGAPRQSIRPPHQQS